MRAYVEGLADQPRSAGGSAPARYQLTFEERKFGAEEIGVDATRFIRCSFSGTILNYLGGSVPIFEDCSFEGVQFSFGGSARNTFEWLRWLKAAGWIGGI